MAIRLNSFRHFLTTALLIGLLFPATTSLHAQADPEKDSLINVIHTAKQDTTRIQALNYLAFHIMFNDADSAITIGREALSIAEKTGNQKEIGNSRSALGVCFMVQGSYDTALAYLFAAKEIRENLPGQKGLIGCIANIGLVYWRMGNYPKALEYYLTALDLDEKKGDQTGMAIDLANIGNVYSDQENNDKALEYYTKALHLDSVLQRDAGIAAMQGNIGIIWYKKGNITKALSCLKVAFAIDSSLDNYNAMARHLGNSGDCYKMRGDSAKSIISRDSNYAAALVCFNRALELDRKTGDHQQMVSWLTRLGTLATKTKNYPAAEKYLNEALSLCAELNELQATLHAEEASAEFYAATGNWQKAYEHSLRAADVRSKLFNDEKSQELGRAEANANYDKQKALDDAAHQSEIDKTNAVAEAREQKQIIILALVGILALAAVAIAFIIFRSLRTAQQQKTVIEKQKLIVEEKNKEIVDSINYARRLQEAILPPEQFWKSNLGETFILYRPKDIVAGDFYWMETSGDLILFAVADCTGHGVPGALVSVVCSTALTRAVNEFGITEPGKLLDKVCELVLATFEKSASNVNDGMDISLCVLNKKTGVLLFSGAHNSAIVVGNGGTVSELKATKQPVGKYDQRTLFETVEASYTKGDMLYLFTDGYADQFGGPKGKKFMHKKLLEQLKTIHTQNMNQQQQILNSVFDQWRGETEQIDDVCISGIRL